MREQQMKALERANVVRFAAADVKRELRDGRLLLGDALFDDRAQSVVLRDLLMAQRFQGPLKVDRLLDTLNVNGYRRVSEITERQKWLVADAS
jgi:hypothetical protein